MKSCCLYGQAHKQQIDYLVWEEKLKLLVEELEQVPEALALFHQTAVLGVPEVQARLFDVD